MQISEPSNRWTIGICVDSCCYLGMFVGAISQRSRTLRAGLLGLCLAAATGCPQGQSKRCRELCSRQADCIERSERQAEHAFEEEACVSACAALERDREGNRLVSDHETCLVKAQSCDAVMACP